MIRIEQAFAVGRQNVAAKVGLRCMEGVLVFEEDEIGQFLVEITARFHVVNRWIAEMGGSRD